jgi:hypothetical protein
MYAAIFFFLFIVSASMAVLFFALFINKKRNLMDTLKNSKMS